MNSNILVVIPPAYLTGPISSKLFYQAFEKYTCIFNQLHHFIVWPFMHVGKNVLKHTLPDSKSLSILPNTNILIFANSSNSHTSWKSQLKLLKTVIKKLLNKIKLLNTNQSEPHLKQIGVLALIKRARSILLHSNVSFYRW